MSCFEPTYILTGEYFVWTIVRSSIGSGEVVLDCKYRSSLKPLLSHLRMVSHSSSGSSGSGGGGGGNSNDGGSGGNNNSSSRSSSSSSSSSGSSAISSSADNSSNRTTITIEKAFFDSGGDVNVSVSLGRPDLNKRYRYSATSQTWQEIY